MSKPNWVMVAPVDGGPPTIEMTPGWYVVWYWADPEHYTNKKFMDYEDALAFAKEHGYDEAKHPTEAMRKLLLQPAAPYLGDGK